MNEAKLVYRNLDELFEQAPSFPIDQKSKIVIFSDLHMGDGSSKDDFLPNSSLFIQSVKDYYIPKGFSMVLNGDIEELQRFSLKKITKQWAEVYELFDEINKKRLLIKTVGNHDLTLVTEPEQPFQYELYESVKLMYKGNPIFIFHGHQASKKYQKSNRLIGFTLKYIANPLRIKNFSVAHDSRKQYKIERRVYNYSVFNKIASVIGHTHRPLFESLSKAERLKYKIEQLCRELVGLKEGEESVTLKSIKAYKKELKSIYRKKLPFLEIGNLYHSIFHIPVLFNSGTVIGKRGITCLEIENGSISLIHWFDKKATEKYLRQTGYNPEQLGDTDFYRMVINKEDLDYIFTRIKVLS
ncbi:MAG: hypothetical protein ACMVP2_14675 [Imperialibacter sp.]|uniref:hypothetical protein n=1 Tax=Imperialibacter sp. TaxID=2038411 RepID=UPI003A8A8822